MTSYQPTPSQEFNVSCESASLPLLADVSAFTQHKTPRFQTTATQNSSPPNAATDTSN